jgi:hypothetical protein
MLVGETSPQGRKLSKVAHYLVNNLVYLAHLDGAKRSIISRLDDCANFLRGKGIYVYFEVEESVLGNFFVTFVVGEAGRVLKKLRQQLDYLSELWRFIEANKKKLPQEIACEKEKLENYADRIRKVISWDLIPSYTGRNKKRLKQACKEGWKLADEIDAYLESIYYLQRMQALTTL